MEVSLATIFMISVIALLSPGPAMPLVIWAPLWYRGKLGHLRGHGHHYDLTVLVGHTNALASGLGARTKPVRFYDDARRTKGLPINKHW